MNRNGPYQHLRVEPCTELLDAVAGFLRYPPAEQERLLAELEREILAANVRHGTDTPAPMTDKPTLRVVRGAR